MACSAISHGAPLQACRAGRIPAPISRRTTDASTPSRCGFQQHELASLATFPLPVYYDPVAVAERAHPVLGPAVALAGPFPQAVQQPRDLPVGSQIIPAVGRGFFSN